MNVAEGVWHCWHCEWSGTLKSGVWKEPERKVVYSRPKPAIQTVSDYWRDWLHKRGLSDKTISENKVTSCSVYMPQIEKETDAVCFPFYRDGEMINAKYRDKDKNFRMCAGAERLLYGFDHIGDNPLIWVEGEMDKLSLYEAGLKSCVSVPDGAPAPNTKNYSSKFAYLESAFDKINTVARHIIAVDSDQPGKCLKDELIRRLGVEKCSIVTWPEGCKDANDVLVKHGKEILLESIESARPAPVEGVFLIEDIYEELVDLYQNGMPEGLKTGTWPVMDEHYRVVPGGFTVVTGIPSHGKSEWLDALLVHHAKKNGQRYAICSPENQPLQLHIAKIAEKWNGKPITKDRCDRMSLGELNQFVEEARHCFSFILPESPTIECILSRAHIEVLRRGINGLVIDPWNEIEHSRPPNFTETEYISDSLRKMRNFARQNRIHLWVVAHPTKLQKNKDTNTYEIPTPYDIAGSANWRNKADNCITVYRNIDSVDIHVQKIRFKGTGEIGTVRFQYSPATGMYSEVGKVEKGPN